MFRFLILTATAYPKFHKAGNTLVSNLCECCFIPFASQNSASHGDTHQSGLLPVYAFLKDSLEDET